MRIHLADIPEEGKAFLWTRETSELNAVLQDLVGSLDYRAEFFIRPINNRDFELTGQIRTQAPEQCSRCGIDFNFPIQQKFHEILIPHQPEDRTGRYARVNHLSDAADKGPDSIEYDSSLSFDMGEYLHEQVGIAVPFNPAPPETEKGDCRLCGVQVKEGNFGYDEALPTEKPQNPFQVLKNLKLQ